jgi:hypothetical protein
MGGWALTRLKSVRVAPASVSERGHFMTLSSMRRWATHRLGVMGVLLAAGVILLLSVSASAQAATPSLLAGEQVDGHNSALNAVSCASPSRCVTGGLDLIVQDHGVRSDLSSQLSPDGGEIASISCVPGTTFCGIADDSGGAYTLSGQTLSSRTQVATTSVSNPNGFNTISCPSQTFCMAIDELGNTFKYSGGTWSSITPRLGALTQTTSSLQVSCTSDSFCIAALPGGGTDEDYYVWDGTSWGSAHVLESTGAIETGLSCTSATFCVATDTSDFALKFTGGTTPWTRTASRLTGVGSVNDLFYVSCAGTFCLASSFQTADTLTTTDGSTWTTGTNIKTANDGFGAGGPTSCATASMCAIVDLTGNGYTYAVPDTLATQPSLAGLATAGSTITLTPGTVSSPDVSVVDSFQRCLGGCTALSGTSYTTTAADVGANIQDSETTGVGLDTEGPFASNTIGPITSPSTGTPTGGTPGGGTPGGPTPGGGTPSGGTPDGGTPGGGTPSGHPENATIGSANVSGNAAQVTVSCPSASSANCSVKVVLVVTETLSGNKVIAVSATKAKKHKRTVTLGSATATVKAGGQTQIKVSLNGAGKKLLTARHTLKVDLSVTEGDKSLATKKVSFTAPKKKQK